MNDTIQKPIAKSPEPINEASKARLTQWQKLRESGAGEGPLKLPPPGPENAEIRDYKKNSDGSYTVSAAKGGANIEGAGGIGFSNIIIPKEKAGELKDTFAQIDRQKETDKQQQEALAKANQERQQAQKEKNAKKFGDGGGQAQANGGNVQGPPIKNLGEMIVALITSLLSGGGLGDFLNAMKPAIAPTPKADTNKDTLTQVKESTQVAAKISEISKNPVKYFTEAAQDPAKAGKELAGIMEKLKDNPLAQQGAAMAASSVLSAAAQKAGLPPEVTNKITESMNSALGITKDSGLNAALGKGAELVKGGSQVVEAFSGLFNKSSPVATGRGGP